MMDKLFSNRFIKLWQSVPIHSMPQWVILAIGSTFNHSRKIARQ